jgi:spore maturation protein CgeB
MWYGNSNPDEVRGHSLNKVYSSAGVIIGESVYAPFYWSNRIYETLGRGGFCVHPNIPGLKDEYTPYEHFIPYRHGDYEGLFEIIDYYLKHPEKRKAIGTAAYEHTKKNHTQSVRCKQLLDVLLAAHDKKV